MKFEADKSGSRTCANPGLSAPILSTPIVSTTVTPLAPWPRPQVTTSGALSASALRSTPIPGYIADDEMVEFERAKQDTITITISQNEAVWWARRDPRTGNFFERKVSEACRAALEGER